MGGADEDALHLSVPGRVGSGRVSHHPADPARRGAGRDGGGRGGGQACLATLRGRGLT